MKMILKTVALCLAVVAMTQTITTYAQETENLDVLIGRQENILISLLNNDSDNNNAFFSPSTVDQPVLSDQEKKLIIVKNMMHYIRLIEGQGELLDELQRQEFPDLDINIILEGRRSPGI